MKYVLAVMLLWASLVFFSREERIGVVQVASGEDVSVMRAAEIDSTNLGSQESETYFYVEYESNKDLNDKDGVLEEMNHVLGSMKKDIDRSGVSTVKVQVDFPRYFLYYKYYDTLDFRFDKNHDVQR